MTGTQGSEPRVLRYCIEYMQCAPASTKMMCAGVLEVLWRPCAAGLDFYGCANRQVPKYLSLCSPARPLTATVRNPPLVSQFPSPCQKGR